MVQTGPEAKGALNEAAPSMAELDIACPVRRADLISQLARRFSTLPPALAAMRRAALLEARAAGHRVGDLADRLSLTSARISQLTADPKPLPREASGHDDH